MIEITDAAKLKIIEILKEDENPLAFLRTFVQGGGCSGFQYGFTLDDKVDKDDFEFQNAGFKLVVDAMSFQYLEGSIIDYKEEDLGSNFVISNPNAVSTCGCGSSFSI